MTDERAEPDKMPAKSTKVKAKAKVKGGLSKKQLSHLEKRLHEERSRVMKELGHYGESFNSSLQASDGDLSSYSFHTADQWTHAMEREKAFLFRPMERIARQVAVGGLQAR